MPLGRKPQIHLHWPREHLQQFPEEHSFWGGLGEVVFFWTWNFFVCAQDGVLCPCHGYVFPGTLATCLSSWKNPQNSRVLLSLWVTFYLCCASRQCQTPPFGPHAPSFIQAYLPVSAFKDGQLPWRPSPGISEVATWLNPDIAFHISHYFWIHLTSCPQSTYKHLPLPRWH